MHLRIPSREVALVMARALSEWALWEDKDTAETLEDIADALEACPADVTPMTRAELVAQVEDVRNRTAYLEGER